MSEVERWLLPDGIEEMLPGEAGHVESLRRRLVDLFKRWGYDYVIPPMVEFTHSLLTGSGQDVDLLTVKLTDQLSGKTMGIRADITPQAARMDAHSLVRQGVNRLCYAGHVMHAKPKGPLGSRTPIQAGVELFGEPGLDADIEVVCLLLETLEASGLPEQYLDLGHVGIYRALAEEAELPKEKEFQLFGLVQDKAMTELESWVKENIASEQLQAWFLELPKLSGSANVLDRAREIYAEASADISVALDELEALRDVLEVRYPDAKLYFDLSELRGYNYLTGIVFGAFAPGVGTPIASGGRYDHVGEAFGRARPATGFAVDLTSLSRQLDSKVTSLPGIFVANSESGDLWSAIQNLRAKGERVVVGLAQQYEPLDYQNCDRKLESVDGEYKVVAYSS